MSMDANWNSESKFQKWSPKFRIELWITESDHDWDSLMIRTWNNFSSSSSVYSFNFTLRTSFWFNPFSPINQIKIMTSTLESRRCISRFDTTHTSTSSILDFCVPVPDDAELGNATVATYTNQFSELEVNPVNIEIAGIDPFYTGSRRIWHKEKSVTSTSSSSASTLLHFVAQEDITCIFRGDLVEKTDCLGVINSSVATMNETAGTKSFDVNIVIDNSTGELTKLTTNKKLVSLDVGPMFEYSNEVVPAHKTIPFSLVFGSVVNEGVGPTLQLLKYHSTGRTDFIRARPKLLFQTSKVLVTVSVALNSLYRNRIHDLNIQASIAGLFGKDVNCEMVTVKIRPSGSYNTGTKIVTWVHESLEYSADKSMLQLEAIVDLNTAGGTLINSVSFVPVIVKASYDQLLAPDRRFQVTSNDCESEMSGKSRIEYKFLR